MTTLGYLKNDYPILFLCFFWQSHDDLPIFAIRLYEFLKLKVEYLHNASLLVHPSGIKRKMSKFSRFSNLKLKLAIFCYWLKDNAKYKIDAYHRKTKIYGIQTLEQQFGDSFKNYKSTNKKLLFQCYATIVLAKSKYFIPYIEFSQAFPNTLLSCQILMDTCICETRFLNSF